MAIAAVDHALWDLKARLLDGFSCREQIEHGTRRQPLALSQMQAMALQPSQPETQHANR